MGEAVYDLLDRVGRDAGGAFEAGIDKCSAADFVLNVTFFFQAQKDGANGGIFEGAVWGEVLLDIGGGGFAALPDDRHKGAFEVGDGGADRHICYAA